MSSSFGLQTISFAFFGAVFMGVSAAASVFILPLLALSFIFSGLVVVFSGLSYTTFKMASSKYNRTVLLLNKLLRKLADTIPPSVGFQEVSQEKKTIFGDFITLPSLNLLERFESLQSRLNGIFRSNDENDSSVIKSKELNGIDLNQQGPDPESFQIENQPNTVIDSDAPIIYDDRFDNENDDTLNDELEQEQEDIPLLNGNGDSTNTPNPSPIDQAIKDGEIDQIGGNNN
ncbi:Aspartyl/asparaginyl beta-hydroxylase [Wickerhamomyces ciferrii]|uniref:Aspartyl/asparaginyl beta-hydroxylase n=1 Tax=Wickerhamomyces ciferrii (strain ATCC 14091 / BCRC 22168 / CBS 111 / JCM 3599 / NBRC 0793 / NRRL Y-1031 F-60-10) TaxID=1206466 RepID=K0KLG0_WICCF|nr:Aspartyl/asparaginyl beta-hydroxylase [Wickerhamomyces ciferrii]CCH46095.1 Aspartyl/asparaginyl beta-hydroxylase [Wickerhamomyces ciferrii]